MAGIMQVEDWHTAGGFLASAESVVTTNVLGPIRLIAAFIEHLRGPAGRHHRHRLLGSGVHPAEGHAQLQRVQGRDPPAQRVAPAAVADTTVQVIELVPPSVRTALMPGQEDNEQAMPLDEFIAEVVRLLESQPDAKEIQVERVKFLRYGEARGDYDQVVAALNAADPHGK